MKKNMICIECPRGCELTVTLEDARVTDVTGNLCPRGKTYAVNECESPRRVVTGTVRTEDGRLLPVRTNGAVLRDRMMDVMAVMASTTARLPLALGDVVVEKIDGECDLVASRSMRKEGV